MTSPLRHETGLESVCGADTWCNRQYAASRARIRAPNRSKDRAGTPKFLVLVDFFLGGGSADWAEPFLVFGDIRAFLKDVCRGSVPTQNKRITGSSRPPDRRRFPKFPTPHNLQGGERWGEGAPPLRVSVLQKNGRRGPLGLLME